MEEYKLYAEREGIEREMNFTGNLNALKAEVERRDKASKWPEGSMAVARPVSNSGPVMLLCDDWIHSGVTM